MSDVLSARGLRSELFPQSLSEDSGWHPTNELELRLLALRLASRIEGRGAADVCVDAEVYLRFLNGEVEGG